MNTSASTSVSEFGKDSGLVHEAVVTGRKVGASQTFWSRLAHNEDLFRRVVKEVMQMVVATQPFDPVSFIGEKWSLIPEERDLRSARLTEVDFATALWEICLNEGESSITGEEKLTRLKTSGKIRLGSTVFLGLWTDYQARKEDSVLERLFKEQKITYLDFFGDVLLNPHGNRYVLYFFRNDGVWHWISYYLGYDWNADHLSASLACESSVLEPVTS